MKAKKGTPERASEKASEYLRLFEPFVDAHPRVLTWAAQRSSLLRLPHRRWLVRSGRKLQGCLYLMRGQVCLLLPGGKHLEISGQTPRARWPVYPGPSAVRTLTEVQLLRLDATREEIEVAARFDGSGASETLRLPELQPLEPCWQHRFLSSALMQRLSAAVWQQLLRAMITASFRAGDAVLVEGRPGDLCYVLRTGRAEVRRSGHVLARLAPGDLFGEEALITGSGRNASIVMTEDGSVMTLSVEAFQRLLLAEVMRTVDETGGRVPLHLVDIRQMSHAGRAGTVSGRGAVCLQLQNLRAGASRLPKDAAYAVSGASAPQRALAVFLLARQGIVAVPLNG